MGLKASSHANAASTGGKAIKKKQGMGGHIEEKQIEDSAPALVGKIGEDVVLVPGAEEVRLMSEEDSLCVVSTDFEVVSETDSESGEDSDEEDLVEEDDYDEEEMAMILADARKLKVVAEAFLHPEKEVESAISVRCYFDRFAAPEVISKEEADERALILADSASLKKLAVDYMHPETGVDTNDPFATGRNFFSRASAPDIESEEEAEERARILSVARDLKKLAVDYAHPEVGMSDVNPNLFARNYFDRASAPDVLSLEDAEESKQILADVAALKREARFYLHPEETVNLDPLSFGRNYFERASAHDVETEEEAEERVQALADAATLKKLAVNFMHPEVSVSTSDSTSFGRNYFNRASAPEVEDQDESEEQAQILADSKAMKKLASDYMHPEIGVTTSDPCAYGRNYFDRVSAPEMEREDEAEERAQILADAAALKKSAVDFMHPELGVNSSDPTSFGRNYFNRDTAPETDSYEEAELCVQILSDTAALKKIATDFMHPEVGVSTSDDTACGRNYFERASAPDVRTEEEAEERARVLADAAALKKLATDFMHPEVEVKSNDPNSFGRNYFERASAHDVETEEEAEERVQALADAAALKKLAVNFMHPEVSVSTSDSASFGRNYFNRASASEVEDQDESEEQAQILADSKAMKKLASDFMHPEIGVTTSDPCAYGRNYFDRMSAPEMEREDDAEERAQILADAAALKKSAVDFMHPELGVNSSDPTSFGRNYFERVSAPDILSLKESEKHALVLADSNALKDVAVGYMHPEVGVTNKNPTAFGRNYFDRSTSPGHSEVAVYVERAQKSRGYSDHFDMDIDDDFAEMRGTFQEFNKPTYNEHDQIDLKDIEEEGNLSRSPSSVMLLGLGA